MKPQSKTFVARYLVRGSFRYARSCAKNCVKLGIGRKPYFTPEDIFFRQYLRHILGIQRIDKITCMPATVEGAGSQAVMVMTAINFARECGLTYVHTPFSDVAHADRPKQEWAAAWEAQFNLGAGEVLCAGDSSRLINFALNLDDIVGLFGLHDLAHMHNVTAAEFRRRYYLNKSPRKTAELTVAVHVRRGDARPGNPYYYTSNETILRTISAVKSVLDSRQVQYSIRLYSQGGRADFAELALPGVEFFLDADAIWTMGELIEADVLVMARGCFSHYAALISDGIKIGGLEPDGGWQLSLSPDNRILCLPDGSFDCAEFDRRLLRLLESKAAATTKAQ